MSGIQMMLFGVKSNLAQGTLLLNNRSLEVSSQSFEPDFCSNTVRYTFKSNGKLESSFTGVSILSTTNNFGQYANEWISGLNATPDKFSVKATIISGSSFPSGAIPSIDGTLDTWLSMTQDREWAISTFANSNFNSRFQSKTCTIRFELAASDNISNILESADVTLSSSSEYISFE